ncbi:MAG TPA: hypothetical protein VGQ53_08380 [Chitinophagaceae bacterium]|jgi:hypothetical protein|nr:hypothetical protein [Chitinophagaceae bacterium]
MKQSKFLLMLLGASITFFLISCGGSEEKKSSDSTSTDTTTATSTTTEPAPVNTISTTPTNMVIVRHKVADFAKWEAAYNADDSNRLANGLHSYVIGRDEKDTNMVMVAMKVDDLAKAKAFAKNPMLKKAMQQGGVKGAPSIKYYTMVFQDTAAIDSKLRTATMFKVKDWAAWQKSFDSTRALKTDNGLTPRAYGYDPDDNHNVVIVAAVLDTAKARAFWSSDLLKQRRAAGGVLGTPERIVYTLVKRY